MVLNRINTNNILQVHRPKFVSLWISPSSKINAHLFLHCLATSNIWSRLFGIFWWILFVHTKLGELLLIRYSGFSWKKDKQACGSMQLRRYFGIFGWSLEVNAWILKEQSTHSPTNYAYLALLFHEIFRPEAPLIFLCFTTCHLALMSYPCIWNRS